MAFTEDLKEIEKDMREDSIVKDEIKNATAPYQQPMQNQNKPGTPPNGVALPNETMNKILNVLKKLPYEAVGDLMDEIKRAAIGANIIK